MIGLHLNAAHQPQAVKLPVKPLYSNGAARYRTGYPGGYDLGNVGRGVGPSSSQLTFTVVK